MKRRTLLIIACVLLITALMTSLLIIYWYVPDTLGKQYVSVSFQPLFYGWHPNETTLHLTYEGRSIDAYFVSVKINITNSYFAPVHFSYNGFDIVWLIYNQTVSDPSDVASNDGSLIYGAYSSLNMWAERYAGMQTFSTGGFQLYAAKKSYTNFTATAYPGTAVKNQDLFFNGFNEYNCWLGRHWLNNSNVDAGTYYMYCIILGITSGPQSVTITSIS